MTSPSVSAVHEVALYRGDKYITIIVIVKGDNFKMNMTAIVNKHCSRGITG
jgi:hypothetical protein